MFLVMQGVVDFAIISTLKLSVLKEVYMDAKLTKGGQWWICVNLAKV